MKKNILINALVFIFMQSATAQINKIDNQAKEIKRIEAVSKNAIMVFSEHSNKRNATHCLIYKQQMDSSFTEFYDTTSGQYVDGIIHYYTYNHDANCILDIQNQWNYSTSTWEKSNKHEMTYDANHNLILDVISEKSLVDNSWELAVKREYAHNGAGSLIMYAFYVWSANNGWEKSSKDEYFVNSNNLPDSVYHYQKSPNLNQWELKSIYVYAYDTNNNVVNQSQYSVNVSTNQRIKSYYKEFLYDTNAWLIKDYSGMYWGSSSVWDTSMMVIHHNDTAGVDTMSMMYTRFAAYGGTWDLKYRTQRFFDSNNNLKSYIQSSWNGSVNQWEYSSKEVRTFDNNYLKSDLVLPPNYYYNTMIISAINYKWSSSNMMWENSELHHYYYSMDATSLEEIQKPSCSIYPNPSSDFIRIDLKNTSLTFDLKLYDVSGKMIVLYRLKNNQLIDIRSMGKGVYFYKIETDKEIYVGKIVKQ